MTTAQKLGSGVIAVAMVTTMILPNRQTKQVIGSIASGARGILATVMGTGRRV